MSFLGINASEFLILVVLAVIFFGPERIPEFSRKAARVVFYVRNIANGATQQLKDELGPEYQDLTLEDLNPKTFVQKHLLDEIQADLDDVRSDLDDVRREVGSAASAATSATGAVDRAVRAPDVVEIAPDPDRGCDGGRRPRRRGGRHAGPLRPLLRPRRDLRSRRGPMPSGRPAPGPDGAPPVSSP